MPIEQIENGEELLSVREKLNEAIEAVNGAALVALEVESTGTFPGSFRTFGVAPGVVSLFPAGISVTAPASIS